MKPNIGDSVRCGVWVAQEFHPMGWGVVVADHNGYSDVHMGGGKGYWNCRPIIESYPYSHMRPYESHTQGTKNG